MGSNLQIYDPEVHQSGDRVGQLIYRVRAALMNALDEVIGRDPDLETLELSADQYVIISVLAKRGVDCATELCKDLSYDAGAMTRMLDRLELKGLISRRRCPDDRRVVRLELTEAGTAVLPKFRECSARVLSHLMLGFPQPDVQMLENLLARVLQ